MTPDLLPWLFEAAVATSAAIGAVLLLRRPLRRLAGPGAAYVAWLAVPAVLVAVALPASETMPAVRAVRWTVETAMPQAAALPAAAAPAVPWLLLAWLAGAGATAASLVMRQRRFRRALGTLRRRPDGLWESPACEALPAVVGWWPRIVLPADFERRYDPVERELVLCHERTHLRRGDVPVAMFASLFRCMFWFNPLVHVAVRCLGEDQELACDAAVLRRHPGRRRTYAGALLKSHPALHGNLLCNPAFGTHPLTERLSMIKRPRSGFLRLATGTASSLVLAGGLAFAAWAAQPATPVPADGDVVALDLAVTAAGQPLPGHAGTFLQNAGEPLSLAAQPDGGPEWSATVRATPAGADRYRIDAEISRDGDVVARPSLEVRAGASTVLTAPDALGGAGAFSVTVTPRAVRTDEAAMRDASIRGPKPAYPASALAAGEGGTVILDLRIAADGRVAESRFVADGSTVAETSALVESAREATRAWRFTPKQEDGEAVEAWVRVPVTFEPDGPAG